MRARLLLLSVLLILLSSLYTQAYGVSYEYMPNKTLSLYPGQNYLFKLIVQNKDPEDVVVAINLSSDIATLVGGPELKVPGQTFDNYVLFNITVPKKAKINDTYEIGYLVYIPDRSDGQIPLAVKYDRGFTVKVVEKPLATTQDIIPEPPKKPILKIVIITLAVIILIIILLIIWKKSRQMSDRMFKKPIAKTSYKPLPVQKSKQELKQESKPEEKPSKKEKITDTTDYFHLKGGKTLRNLTELCSALKNMDKETFNHHVNSSKNDFARWVAYSLENHELAGKLLAHNTKEEMLELVKNELEKQ